MNNPKCSTHPAQRRFGLAPLSDLINDPIMFLAYLLAMAGLVLGQMTVANLEKQMNDWQTAYYRDTSLLSAQLRSLQEQLKSPKSIASPDAASRIPEMPTQPE